MAPFRENYFTGTASGRADEPTLVARRLASSELAKSSLPIVTCSRLLLKTHLARPSATSDDHAPIQLALL